MWGSGVFLFSCDNIPSKLIETKITMEGFFDEINWSKKSESFAALIIPKQHLISDQLQEIGKNIDLFSSRYDNMLMGDLNEEPNEPIVSVLCENTS